MLSCCEGGHTHDVFTYAVKVNIMLPNLEQDDVKGLYADGPSRCSQLAGARALGSTVERVLLSASVSKDISNRGRTPVPFVSRNDTSMLGPLSQVGMQIDW